MRTIKRTLLEFICVAIAGVALGLAANARNPDGLKLTEKYFERPPGGNGATMSELPTDDPSFQFIKEWNLNPISHAKAVELFEDSFYRDGLHVFVDARLDDDDYRDGHIPGAYYLNHIYKERTIDEVVAACQGAEVIVVYCNGGQCDDSIEAAIELQESDLDPDIVFIYAGGFKEWTRKGMPVEQGERIPPWEGQP